MIVRLVVCVPHFQVSRAFVSRRRRRSAGQSQFECLLGQFE